MKLVAEQVEYLRKKRSDLLRKQQQYLNYCGNREKQGLDEVGMAHCIDFNIEVENSSNRHELQEIEYKLRQDEFVMERNFDVIDIGTAFYVKFGDAKAERTMVVSPGIICRGNYIPASSDSDFGTAVMGKKAGDTVTYTVQATGKVITATIEEIDTVRENYVHFIKEKVYNNRVSEAASEELRRLKAEDPEEYAKRQAITESQEELLLEELNKIPRKTTDSRQVARKAIINKLLEESTIAPVPTGDTIEVGSVVEVMLQDGDKEPITRRLEMVNRAVSTETDGAYVERISTLGQAIYGLKENEEFQIKRRHKPNVKGIVTAVINNNGKKRVR